MYSIRVFSTSDRDFPPADFSQGLTWERLTEIVRREVSPRAAAIFAEPIADPGRGLTHWHVTTDDDPIALARLPQAEQARILAALDERRGAILALADRLGASVAEADVRLSHALRASVTVPDPQQHIWSVSGSPLLVAWGRQGSAARPREARLEYRRQPVPGAAATPGAALIGGGKAAPAPAASPKPMKPIGWSGLWPWLSWFAFTAIVAAIFYHLLPACAIGVPPLKFMFDRCSGAAKAEMMRLQDRNDELRAALGNLEHQLAQSGAECRSDRKTEAQPPQLWMRAAAQTACIWAGDDQRPANWINRLSKGDRTS